MSTHHSTDTEAFRRLLVEDATGRAGEHPEADTLVEYLASELSSEADGLVQDHLAGCKECAQKVLDLECLVFPDEASGELADFMLEAAWRDFQARLTASEPAVPVRSFGWREAIAASLLVATVGLLFSVSQLRQTTSNLRQQVADLTQPQVNPPIIYLDEVTRSEPSGVTAELSADQPFVLLIAIPSTPDTFSNFSATVTSRKRGAVWRASGLGLSEEATLRMRLPRELLPPGDYSVRIEGTVDGGKETIIETSLQILDR